MSHIDVVTVKDFWDSNVDGYLPILLEVYNPDITWADKEKKFYGQEDSYIRFIADEIKVIYKGKTYLPCSFEYTPPESDGSKIGSASVTISALDTRVRQVMRLIKLPSKINVIALFGKQEKNAGSGFIYKFVEVNTMSYTMTTASANSTTAMFNFDFDRSLMQQVPYDMAVQERVPATAG